MIWIVKLYNSQEHLNYFLKSPKNPKMFLLKLWHCLFAKQVSRFMFPLTLITLWYMELLNQPLQYLGRTLQYKILQQTKLFQSLMKYPSPFLWQLSFIKYFNNLIMFLFIKHTMATLSHRCIKINFWTRTFF